MKRNKIIIDDFYIDYNGIKHPIKGKEKLEYPLSDSNEYIYAKWIIDTFKGYIHMVPRINTELGNSESAKIKTPDYIWGKERWDLKELRNVKSKRAVSNALKQHKEQANNFFLDISNCKLRTKEIINQVKNIFNDSKYRITWINKIIITKNNKIIGIYQK